MPGANSGTHQIPQTSRIPRPIDIPFLPFQLRVRDTRVRSESQGGSGVAWGVARATWASKPPLGDSSTILSRDARALMRVRERVRGRRRTILVGEERGDALDF